VEKHAVDPATMSAFLVTVRVDTVIWSAVLKNHPPPIFFVLQGRFPSEIAEDSEYIRDMFFQNNQMDWDAIAEFADLMNLICKGAFTGDQPITVIIANEVS